MKLVEYIKENNITTANVSDVMQSMNVITCFIKSIKQNTKMLGRAFTVQAYAGSIITVHKALYEAEKGNVLVVDGGGDGDAGALFGEIMSYEANKKGLAGIVIDGAVRDVDEINEIGFPVFAKAITPKVGTNRRLGQVNVSINCGGVVVNPGDLVFGDNNGLVVIPGGQEEYVVEGLRRLVTKEAGIVNAIDAGQEIAEILNFKDLFYAQEK